MAVLAAADEPVVVCAHRENMPFLLDAACAELGADCPPVEPLRKGEFLVLHRADGKLAAHRAISPRRQLLTRRGPVHDLGDKDGQADGDRAGADAERGRVTPVRSREAAGHGAGQPG